MMYIFQEVAKQDILKTLSIYPSKLLTIPLEEREYEYCLTAVSAPSEEMPCYSVNLLRYVPIEMRTEELCKIAVSRNSHNLGDVPEQYNTYEMCLNAVKQCGERLCDVPAQFMTDEILIVAMQRYHHLLYRENWWLWVWGKIGKARTQQIVEKLKSLTATEFVATPFFPECRELDCPSSFEQCQNFIQEMMDVDWS